MGMPKKVITSEVKIHFCFALFFPFFLNGEIILPESLAPSGHFSEMMAKKTGPFGPFYLLVKLQSHRINMPDMIGVSLIVRSEEK